MLAPSRADVLVARLGSFGHPFDVEHEIQTREFRVEHTRSGVAPMNPIDPREDELTRYGNSTADHDADER